MPNEKGFYDMHQPDSKTQPAKVLNRGFSKHGDGHDFNEKGKITNTAGSDYHDVARPNAGLHGNFSEKDAQIKYLTERGKKGQVIRSYSGNQEQSRLHTYNQGSTAYPTRPIDEVYKPATSQHIPESLDPKNIIAKESMSSAPHPDQKYNAKRLK